MSCVGDSCGVGGWGGPKPGDPSTDGTLQARGVPGGIQLSWTLPSTNAFAVAHAVVYRSISNQFINAIPISTWAGTEFFDRVPHGTQYWYWVQFVSINGTVMEPIGPATAVAQDSVAQMIIDLSGLIDRSVLAQALKTEIDRIQPIGAQVAQEIQDRLASNQALVEFMQDLEANVGQVMTLVQDETTQRQDGDATLLERVNTLAVGQGDTVALITEERNLRIDADSALSEKVDLTYAQVGTDINAAKLEVTTAYAGADQALAQTVAQTYATKNGLSAAIQSVEQAIVDGDGALSSRIDTLEASGGVDSVARAAVQEETTARVREDGLLSQRITTLETAGPDGSIAQVEQKLDAYITTNDGKVTNIGAMYTVKTNVNGLIGGFGTYNDGTTVQMGFDVDSFWVGRGGYGTVRPFMIANGAVYINTAYIADLQVDKITSGNMNAEWRLTGGNAKIIMDNGVVMKVMGNGFGAQGNLLSWFGPSMPVWQCSTTNATNYETTGGDAYWGGSLRAGVLYNAQQTTSVAYNASVPLGPFWSNGNPKNIVVSYTYNYELQNRNMSNQGYTATGESYAVIQLWRGNAFITERRFDGNSFVNNEFDGPDSAWVSISGSFTYTDTGGAGDYTYSAVIVSRVQANLVHSSGSSTSSSTRQTLGLVSTEQ